MKRAVLLTIAIGFVMFAGTAWADVTNSKHNLGIAGLTTYRTNDTSEVCAFCHTPHNARLNVPLWARSVQIGGYMLYTTSATLTSSVGASSVTSDNISFRCLGCHDGTIAPTTVARGRIRGTNTPLNANFATSYANLGTDLTNDHPIGFSYANAAAEDTDLTSVSGGKAGGELPLFNVGGNANNMECATCHDVHNGPGVEKFLRKSNATSALCRSCHQK